MKRQIPAAVVIAPALLLVAAVAFFLLVKPKMDESSSLDGQIAELQGKIDVALAAQRASGGETIRVADLFRLTKAMPDTTDMSSVILEVNAVVQVLEEQPDLAAALGFVCPVEARGGARVLRQDAPVHLELPCQPTAVAIGIPLPARRVLAEEAQLPRVAQAARDDLRRERGAPNRRGAFEDRHFLASRSLSARTTAPRRARRWTGVAAVPS